MFIGWKLVSAATQASAQFEENIQSIKIFVLFCTSGEFCWGSSTFSITATVTVMWLKVINGQKQATLTLCVKLEINNNFKSSPVFCLPNYPPQTPHNHPFLSFSVPFTPSAGKETSLKKKEVDTGFKAASKPHKGTKQDGQFRYNYWKYKNMFMHLTIRKSKSNIIRAVISPWIIIMVSWESQNQREGDRWGHDKVIHSAQWHQKLNLARFLCKQLFWAKNDKTEQREVMWILSLVQIQICLVLSLKISWSECGWEQPPSRRPLNMNLSNREL